MRTSRIVLLSAAGFVLAALAGCMVQRIETSRNGARFRDLVEQLDAVPGQRYDAILIMAGGNDVLQLTGESTAGHCPRDRSRA